MSLLSNLFKIEPERKHLIIKLFGLRLKFKIKTDYEQKQFNSEQNLEQIKKLRNKYKGKRCFVIGGAPSLSQLDLTKLNNEYTITVGKGYKLQERDLKHSTVHVLSDYHGYKESRKEINPEYSDMFLISSQIPLDINIPNKVFFSSEEVKNGQYTFKDDLEKPLQTCQTVIGVALSAAAHLGFSEIIIIGVDLDFKNNSGHIYQESNGEKERQITHSVSNQEIMYNGLKTAAQNLQKKGVKVINASPAGNLDFIDRVRYETLFDKE